MFPEAPFHTNYALFVCICCILTIYIALNLKIQHNKSNFIPQDVTGHKKTGNNNNNDKVTCYAWYKRDNYAVEENGITDDACSGGKPSLEGYALLKGMNIWEFKIFLLSTGFIMTCFRLEEKLRELYRIQRR